MVILKTEGGLYFSKMSQFHLFDSVVCNITFRRNVWNSKMSHFGQRGGGAHWALMWHFARRGLHQFLMPDYSHRCRTSKPIMVPLNFWWNSNPFKKSTFFLSKKLRNLSIFPKKNISKIRNKHIGNSPRAFMNGLNHQIFWIWTYFEILHI